MKLAIDTNLKTSPIFKRIEYLTDVDLIFEEQSNLVVVAPWASPMEPKKNLTQAGNLSGRSIEK